MRVVWLSAPLVLAAALVACSASHDRAPGLGDGLVSPDAGSSDASGFFDVVTTDGPPDLDAQGLCGNLLIPALADPPNIYFVLDRSGSMLDVVDGTDKYTSTRKALVALVRALGASARIGAATFPDPALSAQNQCVVGAQVFATQPGDAAGVADGGDGPVTVAFAKAIGASPGGGTPTAATLAKLYPTLTALEGRTYVILATDGGPNCNTSATCPASDCMANIEGAPGCDAVTNCCAPGSPYGPPNCLDAEPTTTAIANLKAAGIDTYVIGLPSPPGTPGTSTYAPLLDEMASAGGTARATDPLYYDIQDMAALEQVLMSIGATLLVTCDFDLAQLPPDPAMVNVYLDKKAIPYDATNGWTWKTPTQVELTGAACDSVKNKQVQEVQIVAGCPTKQPS